MSYIVASKVKDYLNGKGMMMSGDLPDALSGEVEQVLGRAVKRAQSNDRKTVRPGDL
jgi:histone H3/H4